MKSTGGLFEKIVASESLEAAMWRASRGKRDRPGVQAFLSDSAARLAELQQCLASGSYVPLPYHQFRILDPKPRLISCADFRDLVVWSDSKSWLWGLAGDLSDYLAETRQLALKSERTLIAPCGVGVPFLGYRVFPGLLREQGRRVRRRRRLLRQRELAFQRGDLSAEQLVACVRSMNGSRQFLRAGAPLHSELEI